MSLTLPTDSVELVAFHRLFDNQVNATPDRIAVYFEDESWSYRQLSLFADAIACVLVDRGLAREECVGLCLDRSPGAIAAMLGIMKAGGAFVPLDPELPSERIAFMLEDARIGHVICDQHYADLLAGFGSIQWMTLESLRQKNAQTSDFRCQQLPDIEADQLAYVMYTSGSTGKPKGVMIEHRALSAYCLADIEVYNIQSDDRTLHFSTINFDISIEEIFPPLLTGSSVVVRPRHRADTHNELSALINQYQITAVHLATAYWHEWVDLMMTHGEHVPSSLRLLIATGEKVSIEHYKRWNSLCRHNVQWSNAYGPTEATVSSTVFTPSRDWVGETMPIGKPLSRYSAFILDEQGHALQAGGLGELVIGGPALARGYLNRPDLTAKSFVTWKDSSGLLHRIYRTGDLARWDQDGNIEFAGRIDHQIKVGSYRIEPGEIESAINQNPHVLESLVVYEQIGNQKYLIAYVSTQSNSLTALELSTFLRERIPVYMVPSRYIFVARFPKTLNGKIDRRALPSAEQAETPSVNDSHQSLDDMETRLAKIWSDVLQVSAIGRDDNFFFLGGSSLLVTRVISRIKQELDLELPVRDVFANPLLHTLATHVRSMRGEKLIDSNLVATSRAVKIPQIESHYISSGTEKLFSVFYPGMGQLKNHAVLICGSMGHEYARAHRNLQQLAQLLAENGFDVLRFDYCGTGNSSGICGSGTPEQWENDIRHAAQWMKERCPSSRFSAIGLRFGATLLANVPDMNGDTLLLWDPALSGASYLSQLAQFHRRALCDFVRYPHRRRALPNQYYGLITEEKTIPKIYRLRLPQHPPANFRSTHLLTTHQYWLQECDASALTSDFTSIQHHEVPDEVMWHHPQYTERAFASPNVYRRILQVIAKGVR